MKLTVDDPHFALAARLIGLMNGCGGRISTDALAAEANLNPTQLTQLFTDYIGISPKRLQQFLTAQEAQHYLQTGHTVLDTSQALQLSSPSRVHDVMIATDAMPPRAVAQLGAGLTLRWGVVPSPITAMGEVFMAQSEHGICLLNFGVSADNIAQHLAQLAAQWPAATIVHDADACACTAKEMWHEPRQHPLHIQGTNFQLQVWQALLRIPLGQLSSYQAVATQIQRPKATRAVGTAVGANPIAILIPCHRVLRGTGMLGGYAGGLPRKLQLLAQELTLN